MLLPRKLSDTYIESVVHNIGTVQINIQLTVMASVWTNDAVIQNNLIRTNNYNCLTTTYPIRQSLCSWYLPNHHNRNMWAPLSRWPAFHETDVMWIYAAEHRSACRHHARDYHKIPVSLFTNDSFIILLVNIYSSEIRLRVPFCESDVHRIGGVHIIFQRLSSFFMLHFQKLTCVTRLVCPQDIWRAGGPDSYTSSADLQLYIHSIQGFSWGDFRLGQFRLHGTRQTCRN